MSKKGKEALDRIFEYRRFNILSIDNSGIPTKHLDVLRTRYKNFFRNTDLIVSTSAGAIQACSLAAGKDIEKLGNWPPEGDDFRPFLEEQFEGMQMGELDKKVALVAKGEIWVQVWEILHNYPGMGSSEEMSVVDAIFRTMDPPLYNPCLVGAAQAIKEGALIDQLRILSLGNDVNSMMQMIDIESRMLFRDRYHRVSAPTDKDDNFSLRPSLKWLDRYWK